MELGWMLGNIEDYVGLVIIKLKWNYLVCLGFVWLCLGVCLDMFWGYKYLVGRVEIWLGFWFSWVGVGERGVRS